MKRPASKKYGYYRLIHPLTKFCFCLKCRFEVSREPVWEVNTRNNDQVFYLCKECAPTEQHVIRYAKAAFRLYVTKNK